MGWRREGTDSCARTRGPLLFVVLAALALAVAGRAPSAAAALADRGHEGLSTLGAGVVPSGSKPESKLWWNDGFWWGSLWDTGSGAFHIFRLNAATQSWVDTGTALDDRTGTRADALWDNQAKKLYVASHVFADSGASPSRLYRYSYDGAANTYSLDAGFPATINGVMSETLVIDKDSTGKLWATWTEPAAGGGRRVMVASSGNGGQSWSQPLGLASGLSNDDISSVVAFGGSKIGVMWSDQPGSRFRFAVHRDGQPAGSWTIEPALEGTKVADDHVNLKADRSGRVFAAVKTDSEPLVLLLARAPGGAWKSHRFGRNQDHHTRPIVVIDEANGVLHMFATSGEGGGAIYEKTSPIGTISFPTGLGTPVIQDISDPALNDATSTKQNVNGTRDLAVLATNSTTSRYWHAYRAISGGSPPLPAPSVCTISGTPGDDELDGTSGDDVICGLGGNDRLLGRGGNDDLRGGPGSDRLSGGAGNDKLLGALGRDRLDGGRGKDVLKGQAGNDRLRGRGGRDTFRGGSGADTLVARDGRAELVDGGLGRDRARVDLQLDTLVSIAALF
jgi:Ca2+-binding RTX toxin-like protein